MKRALLLCLLLPGICIAAHHEGPSALKILEDFAVDFQTDPMAPEQVTFGVHMTDSDQHYQVSVASSGEGEPRQVSVSEGAPAEPTFLYTVDMPTLQKLHSGDWNALTAMAKAFSTDVTPMDIDTMEGFAPDESFGAMILPLTFHFWSRGAPEIVKFGDLDYTRFTHGAHATLMYYQPGIRLGMGIVLPGEHVNKDERSRNNPFPSYFIMIEGSLDAVIGDQTQSFSKGEAMMVPPGIDHQFINNGDAPAQLILVMFGEGA